LRSCCRITGNAPTETSQRAPTRRIDKIAERLKINANNAHGQWSLFAQKKERKVGKDGDIRSVHQIFP